MTKTQDIRDAVEDELSYDPLVDMSDITVKNINGEVALNGTVSSFPQYLEAAAAARRVAGVKNVHNHLEVTLPPEDYRDDVTLTTMANNALTQNIAALSGWQRWKSIHNGSWDSLKVLADDALANPEELPRWNHFLRQRT